VRNIRQVIMLLIAGTVAAAIVLTLISWLLIGPERVPPDSRERMYVLISLLVGIVSGYVLGKTNGKG
jgi:hypothetical protein